jgi:hypothetical protein
MDLTISAAVDVIDGGGNQPRIDVDLLEAANVQAIIELLGPIRRELLANWLSIGEWTRWAGATTGDQE